MTTDGRRMVNNVLGVQYSVQRFPVLAVAENCFGKFTTHTNTVGRKSLSQGPLEHSVKEAHTKGCK